MQKKISFLSRVLLIVAAIALIISLFVPVWSIYLDAPQYPEGLRLQIWANAIAGDVDIINGLNHYIGMKTLHSKDFIEFTILPYIIVAYALLFILAAFVGGRRWLNIAFVMFLLFGIIAMVDFWKWEYDYGHNLDPNAAIKVPGMAYQPPLIGFKQLLNFGAYSIPDIGGWLIVIAGALLLIGVVMENKFLKRFHKNKTLAASFAGITILFTSCTGSGPQPISLNKDACDFCKMTISDGRFAAEFITAKGRMYKFDDLSCMMQYIASQGEGSIKKYYISEFTKELEYIDATTAWYIHHEDLKSPMNGNTAAFSTKEAATDFAQKYQATVIRWPDLNKAKQQPDHKHNEHAH